MEVAERAFALQNNLTLNAWTNFLFRLQHYDHITPLISKHILDGLSAAFESDTPDISNVQFALSISTWLVDAPILIQKMIDHAIFLLQPSKLCPPFYYECLERFFANSMIRQLFIDKKGIETLLLLMQASTASRELLKYTLPLFKCFTGDYIETKIDPLLENLAKLYIEISWDAEDLLSGLTGFALQFYKGAIWIHDRLLDKTTPLHLKCKLLKALSCLETHDAMIANILTSELLKAIQTTLQSETDQPTLIHWSLKVIIWFSAWPSLKHAFLEQDIMKVLLHLWTHPNPKVLEKLNHAIWCLTGYTQHRLTELGLDDFVRDDIRILFQKIWTEFNSQDVGIQTRAAQAIETLAQEPNFIRLIAKSSVIRALLAKLNIEGLPFKKYLADTLFWLSVFRDEMQTLIVDLGGVPTLMSLLADPDPELVRAALGALVNLPLNEKNKSAFLQESYFEFFANLLDSPVQKIVKNTLQLLFNITYQLNLNMLLPTILRQRLLVALQNLLLSEDTKISKYSLHVLCNLAAVESTVKEMISLRLCPAIFRHLFSENLKSQNKAWILARFLLEVDSTIFDHHFKFIEASVKLVMTDPAIAPPGLQRLVWRVWQKLAAVSDGESLSIKAVLDKILSKIKQRQTRQSLLSMLNQKAKIANQFGLPFLTYHDQAPFKREKYFPELLANLPTCYTSGPYAISPASSYVDTTYLTSKDAEAYRVQVKNGLVSSGNSTVITTDGAAIVCMTLQGKLYSAKKVEGLQHTSFNRGGYLLFAGYWQVDAGKIRHINAESGHYETSPVALQNFVHLLMQADCDLAETRFCFADRRLLATPSPGRFFDKTEMYFDLDLLLSGVAIAPKRDADSLVTPVRLKLVRNSPFFCERLKKEILHNEVETPEMGI
jgi:hypothetical protein